MSAPDCIWITPLGVCGWDITVPDSQVLCNPCGCKDYEARSTPKDYNDSKEREWYGRVLNINDKYPLAVGCVIY